MKAYLILSDGAVYAGASVGAKKDAFGALTFNSEIISYTDVLSDRANEGAAIMFSYPLIGNVGLSREDFVAKKPCVSSLIVRELVKTPSNYKTAHTLAEYLEEYGITAIEGIDTREITRRIAKNGAQKALVTTRDAGNPLILSELKRELSDFKYVKTIIEATAEETRFFGSASSETRIAVMNFGCGEAACGYFSQRGAYVGLFSAGTDAEEVLAFKPDGIFFSDGSENHLITDELLSNVKKLTESEIPAFGIGLANIICSVAHGAKTEKLNLGHHGCNCPVGSPIGAERTYITNQNHTLVISEKSLSRFEFTVDRVNKNDGTIEGVSLRRYPVKTVQFRPDFTAGEQTTGFLYDEFLSKTLKKGI